MGIREAANYRKICEQTAYRLVLQGKIPGLKLSGRWKIKKDHLDKMLDEILNVKLSELNNR